MANCTDLEILRLGDVRSFLQIPDPRTCGRQKFYYGKECQFMEIDGVSRAVRAQGTKIRTWNRRTRTWCTIGQTEAPPDNTQFTLRFYEACGRGIPWPHVAGRCRVRAVNNYGAYCEGGDDITDFGFYAEVLDFYVLSEDRGRRSSYDGADDPLVDSLTAELLNVFDISTVTFSEVAFSALACTAGDLQFNNASFGCFTGCGERSCGCQESCDDGTYTFYYPASCAGSTVSQYLIYTSNGGEQTADIMLSGYTGGGTATQFPQSVVRGRNLYMLAFQNPAALFEIKLDAYGKPISNTQLYLLNVTDTLTTVATGVPKKIFTSGDEIHMLVTDAATGDRMYTYGGNRTPEDGPRHTFPIAASPLADMDGCDNQFITGGVGGMVFISEDSGVTWTMVTSPTTNAITATTIVDGRYWISDTAGGVWYSADPDTRGWTKISLTGAASVTDIAFANDDVGWVVGPDGFVYSSWIGGLDREDWSNEENRVSNLPSTFDTLHATIPQCADAGLASNVVLLTGTNAAGEYTSYIGRPIYTGY